MSFLTDIKRRLFRNNLEKRQRGAGRQVTASGPVNPDTAGRIVILYPADSAEDRKVVDKWRDAHKKTTNKIEVLGYFSTDVGSASFDLIAVTPKTLNWYGVPVGEDVEQFLKTPCDLLIRLGPAEHTVLDFLVALKPATLKIGPRSTAADSPYHLQFDTHGNEQPRAAFSAIERIFSFTNASATS